MANVTLMGWDAAAKVWRKVVVNAAGKLIIDPSEIFEEVPTNNEAGKAPTSNWAFDHKADASAHHARYNDAEAVASWYNRKVTLTPGIYTNYDVTNVSFIDLNTENGSIYLKGLTGGIPGQIIMLRKAHHLYVVTLFNGNTAAAPADRICTTSGGDEYIIDWKRMCFMLFYTGTFWQSCYFLLQSFDLYLEDTPGNGVTNKAPTSNWAYDHNANASAHHARYTDAEAKAAVGYNGTKYWSCTGIHFDAVLPSTDNVTKSTNGLIIANADNITLVAQMFLPHEAVVTNIIVLGNAAATAETWELFRLDVSAPARVTMAGANINSSDNSIDYANIDNGSYSYFIVTSSLDTNDEVWGVKMVYTI